MSFRPLLFVVMPFGKKLDPTSRVEIDFDDLYERVLQPSAVDAELDVLRADEDMQGGFIHLAMYERLLLAEIVLADLTLANPNVFYELGIRHAARPRATLLIFAKGSGLPFDVMPIRALPYVLDGSVLAQPEAEALREEVTKRLVVARDDREQKDSPLFQLVKDYPGIELPHEVTESFRDRVGLVIESRRKIDDAVRQADRAQGIRTLQEIERSLGDIAVAPVELLLDLLLAYRDASSWDDMIRLYESFPNDVQRSIPVREQLSLALNRRNQNDDRRRAVQVLKEIIESQGGSPETCGLLGRIYKDQFEEFDGAGDTDLAHACLDDAIDWYAKGFDADPRDYYPGINLITLLLRRGGGDDAERVEELRHVVAFAVGRRGGLTSDDYWDVATVLELSVIGEDWATAMRAAARAAILSKAPWMVETTTRNLTILRGIRDDRSQTTQELDRVIKTLQGNPR